MSTNVFNRKDDLPSAAKAPDEWIFTCALMVIALNIIAAFIWYTKNNHRYSGIVDLLFGELKLQEGMVTLVTLFRGFMFGPIFVPIRNSSLKGLCIAALVIAGVPLSFTIKAERAPSPIDPTIVQNLSQELRDSSGDYLNQVPVDDPGDNYSRAIGGVKRLRQQVTKAVMDRQKIPMRDRPEYQAVLDSLAQDTLAKVGVMLDSLNKITIGVNQLLEYGHPDDVDPLLRRFNIPPEAILMDLEEKEWVIQGKIGDFVRHQVGSKGKREHIHLRPVWTSVHRGDGSIGEELQFIRN